MNVGLIGTPCGLTRAQRAAIASVLLKLKPETLHYGDTVGDDQEFDKIARSLPVNIIIHAHVVDAEHPFEGRAQLATSSTEIAKPVKRLEALKGIVDSSHTVVFAPTEPEERKTECWWAYAYARRRLRKLVIVLPSGMVKAVK